MGGVPMNTLYEMRARRVPAAAAGLPAPEALHSISSVVSAVEVVELLAAATRNFMALEIHSVDVPWWKDLVRPAFRIEDGFVLVPDAPGLGIEALNEDLVREKLHPDFPEPWAPTDEWDKEWANDRRWS